jgi:hypothetical protein
MSLLLYNALPTDPDTFVCLNLFISACIALANRDHYVPA